MKNHQRVKRFLGFIAIVTLSQYMSTYFAARKLRIRNLQELTKSMENITVDLKHLSLMFVGDSLTRYQYLSLVHYAKYNEWVDPKSVPNLVNEHQHKSWMDFYNFSNTLLHPFEQCDCYRAEKFTPNDVIENRYYFDSEKNVSITYIQKFTDPVPFKSKFSASNVHDEHSLMDDAQFNHNYSFSTLSWLSFVTDFASKIHPKPKYFVFNQGAWGGLAEFTLPENQQALIKAIRDAGMVSIYKTTTPMRHQRYPIPRRGYEAGFCSLADICLDTSWLTTMPGSVYWDSNHFHEPIYALLNMQLLKLLSEPVIVNMTEII